MNDGADYEQAKSGWAAAGLAPLWDSAVSHKPNNAAAQLLAWRWADLEPHIANAINLVSPEHVERRVLLFADPALSAPGRAQTSRMLNAAVPPCSSSRRLEGDRSVRVAVTRFVIDTAA